MSGGTWRLTFHHKRCPNTHKQHRGWRGWRERGCVPFPHSAHFPAVNTPARRGTVASGVTVVTAAAPPAPGPEAERPSLRDRPPSSEPGGSEGGGGYTGKVRAVCEDAVTREKLQTCETTATTPSPQRVCVCVCDIISGSNLHRAVYILTYEHFQCSAKICFNLKASLPKQKSGKSFYLDVESVHSTADGVQRGDVSHRPRLVVATTTQR